MSAREVPNEAAYSSDFEFAALELAENYRAALVRAFAPYLRGDVIEVGAGIGHVSRQLAQEPGVRRLTAIEPGAALARTFRERLPEVELIEGTIDALDAGREPDAIVSINVLEHVREDQAELAKYARLLAPRRGQLCLFVPARQEIYAPIDRDFGHHRRYEKRALRAMLEHAGFRLERLDYFNLVGYVAWWINFCVLKQRAFDVGKVKLFDRVIFPVVHGLERRVGAPPIGQSLICIAEARG